MRTVITFISHDESFMHDELWQNPMKITKNACSIHPFRIECDHLNSNKKYEEVSTCVCHVVNSEMQGDSEYHRQRWRIYSQAEFETISLKKVN